MNDQAHYLLARLPDIGDGLAGAFQALHNDPEPSACEVLAERLRQASAHVLRLAEAIQASDPPTV